MQPTSTTKQPTPLLAWVLGFIGIAIFGGTLPVTKLALQDFGPWFLTFFRAFIAALCAILFLLSTSRKFKHKQNLSIFIAGLLLIFGFPGFLAIGLQTVPASHAGVIIGFLPLATAVIASLIAGEKQSKLFWAFSMIGALIVAVFAIFKGSDENPTGAPQIEPGDAWIFLAALCAAFGYVMAGKTSRQMPGWEMICRALMLNFPIIALGSFLLFEPIYLSPTGTGIIALLYLGLGSMFLGFFAWNTALAIGGIGKISQMQLLQTFITLFVAWILLGEKIDLVTILTATLITGLIFISRKL